MKESWNFVCRLPLSGEANYQLPMGPRIGELSNCECQEPRADGSQKRKPNIGPRRGRWSQQVPEWQCTSWAALWRKRCSLDAQSIPERCSEITTLYNHISPSQQHGHTEHRDALKPWIHLSIYPCHFSCHAVPNCTGHLAVLATEPNLYLTIPRGSQQKRWKGEHHYDFTKYSRPPFFPHPLSLVSEKKTKDVYHTIMK